MRSLVSKPHVTLLRRLVEYSIPGGYKLGNHFRQSYSLLWMEKSDQERVPKKKASHLFDSSILGHASEKDSTA